MEPNTSQMIDALRMRYSSEGKPIEVDFRKLVDWIRLGDQLTHQIHPYPAKLLPNIAHFFLRSNYLRRDKKIALDPFCGSGTVALETSLAGGQAYVADANPLALLITKAKTTPYNPDELRIALAWLNKKIKQFKKAPEIPIVNQHLWYEPTKKKDLEIILRAISELESEEIKSFYMVCFSVVARRVSYADPAISVPVRIKSRAALGKHGNEQVLARLNWISNVNTNEEFSRICEFNIQRVIEANTACAARKPAIVVGIDSRNLRSPNNPQLNHSLNANSIPLIITSPPYGSAQKYIRATSLSLNWLGLATPSQLSLLESRSIGREHLPSFRNTLADVPAPQEFEKLIRKIEKINPNRAKITRQYLYEMHEALVEMVRVTSKNGHIVLVVGNNVVCGNPLRNDHYVSDVMQSLGMKLEISLIDHIKSRGLMTKRNKTASVISRESVLVFKK